MSEGGIKGEAERKATELATTAEKAATSLLNEPDVSLAKRKAEEVRSAAVLRASEILAIASLRAEQLEVEKARAEEQRDILLHTFQGQLIPVLGETSEAMKGVKAVLENALALLRRDNTLLDERTVLFAEINAKLDGIARKLGETID
jgi:hypothetical protein